MNLKKMKLKAGSLINKIDKSVVRLGGKKPKKDKSPISRIKDGISL
jgi:hypothetical protein